MRPRNILKLGITFFYVDFDQRETLCNQRIRHSNDIFDTFTGYCNKIILNCRSGFVPLSNENFKTTQSLLKICVRPNIKTSLAFEALTFDLLSNSSH